jgi:hypothetical protein
LPAADAAHGRKERLMHTCLRPVLLSLAAVAVTVSSAAPALASTGPALPPGAVHGDLSSWSVVHTPNRGTRGNTLNAVSCVSATACTAVGEHESGEGPGRTLVESWDGTAWSVLPSPDKDFASASDDLNSVSCVPASGYTAAGYYELGDEPLANKTLAESNDAAPSSR